MTDNIVQPVMSDQELGDLQGDLDLLFGVHMPAEVPTAVFVSCLDDILVFKLVPKPGPPAVVLAHQTPGVIQFDPNSIAVEADAAFPDAGTGMPGHPIKRHQLHQLAFPSNDHMS